MTIPALSSGVSPASQPLQPHFGRMTVDKASIVRSGLEQDAADDIETIAKKREFNDNSPLNPFEGLDRLGIDIEIKGSKQLNNQEVPMGPVTVVYKKSPQSYPFVGKELHRFENFYTPGDKDGAGFFGLILEEALKALDALYKGKVPLPQDPN